MAAAMAAAMAVAAMAVVATEEATEAEATAAAARAAAAKVAAAARVAAAREVGAGATVVAVAQAELAAELWAVQGRGAADPSLLQRGSSAQPKTQMA